MGTRIVKLLKILIKIGIMLLIMTGLVLFNRYISNANGSEKEGQKTLLEEMAEQRFIYTLKLDGDSYECIGSITADLDVLGSPLHFKFTMINRAVPKIKIDQALIGNTCFL